MLPPLAFLTWRESVVGVKPTEMVQMDVRRTWDVLPTSSSGTNGGRTLGGDTTSETLGFVRWRLRKTTLFDRPMALLRSETYDKATATLLTEEVWTTPSGDIVRQREERATEGGRETADAAFYADRIELTRVKGGKSTFAALYPAGGMADVQRRFRPMVQSKKEFSRLDGLAGTFRKVVVERTGRFRGTWGGDAYDGAAYRFALDGTEQTLMITPQDEIVQVGFGKGVSLVLVGPTKSRRKPGFGR